ncbi:DUF4397 domain-containing protein [Halorussus halophilus]|uniref:DUF4397 domain-containing protein n=1 Tax=Halorussus halophilus TaxID=2650975 RepID=UPI001300D7EC|nr:DUF4397 domain-containing protein [Halorussus halophilus]
MVKIDTRAKIGVLAVALLVVASFAGFGGSVATLATAQDTTEDGETTVGEETTVEGEETTVEGEETTVEGEETTAVGAEGDAQIRVAHMSPDAPAVEVRVDNQTLYQNVSYGEVSSYVATAAGEHSVTILTAENGSVVFEGNVSLSADTRYTVAAAGEVSENATQPFEPIVLEDASEAPGAGEASVRLVHVAPDAPAVDVTVNSTGAVLFDDVAFGDDTEYVTVPAGDYRIDVRNATEDDNGTVVGTFNISLAERSAYSGFASGYVSEDAPTNNSFRPFVVLDVTESENVTTVGNETTTVAETETAMPETETAMPGTETTAVVATETTELNETTV